jgi:uncharacterized protein
MNGTPADARATPLLPISVLEAIGRRGPALVALSGGVDSSVVALLARRALGPDAVAVTLVGPAVSPEEIEAARGAARSIGIRHELVPADPLEDPRYARNADDRCYFCRKVEGRVLVEWGRSHGVVQRLDGLHRDDLEEDRPGIRAMEEAGFRHPLLEAGWGKLEIRAFARSAGLPNWDRPSNACLASRIPHGTPVTRELLARIQVAEQEVLGLGFRRVRVRVREGGARVEVEGSEVSCLLAEPTAGTVVDRLRRLGFQEVDLDATGYRPRRNA